VPNLSGVIIITIIRYKLLLWLRL